MEYLGKEEIKKVIEGRGCPSRPPILYDMWIFTEVFGERREEYDSFLATQPRDVDFVDLKMPDTYQASEDAPDYRWAPRGVKEKEGVGIDQNSVCLLYTSPSPRDS